MNTKDMITTSLLLAMGLVLHTIVPGILGMKFDLLLIFMFLAILINPSFKNMFLSGVTAGVLSALTTTFPAGQFPNIIDKIFTAFFVFLLIKFMKEKISPIIRISIISFLGTIFSGVIFLTSALFLVGLPAPIEILIISVVLPTSFMNTFISSIIFKSLYRIGPIRKIIVSGKASI